MATPKKRPKLDTKTVAAALRDKDGNVAAAAKVCGVHRVSLHKFISKHPALQAVVADARETMDDVAEQQLEAKVRAGDMTAIIFYLKTRCKSRGYSERTELKVETTPAAVMSPEQQLAAIRNIEAYVERRSQIPNLGGHPSAN